VFVTGASGFVGAHLVYALLQKNYAVTALVRSPENLDAFHALSPLYPGVSTQNVNWVTGDLLFPEGWLNAVADADAVFHAAALVSFSAKDRHLLMETNVKGTTHIVNACLQCNQKPLIYVSSVAALGRSEEEVTEHTPWVDSGRNTDYAVSKYLAEQEVWRGVEEGLNAVIINPCVILGPGNWDETSLTIFKKASKGMTYYPTGSNATVDARDVAICLVKLVNGSFSNDRFLCIGTNQSIQQLFTEIASQSKAKVPKSLISKKWLVFISRISSPFYRLMGKKSPLSMDTINSAYKNLKYDNSKIIQATSHDFYSLQETVRNTLKAGKF